MKTLITFIAFLILITSCKDDDYIKSKNTIASITRVVMPDSATVMDSVQIQATAAAPNDCWSNLHVQFDRPDTFVYAIRAFGDFESRGTCNDTLITKDTTFTFVPPDTGTYYFLITLNEFYLDVDTLVVR